MYNTKQKIPAYAKPVNLILETIIIVEKIIVNKSL